MFSKQIINERKKRKIEGRRERVYSIYIEHTYTHTHVYNIYMPYMYVCVCIDTLCMYKYLPVLHITYFGNPQLFSQPKHTRLCYMFYYQGKF